jgi:hypothetical protein
VPVLYVLFGLLMASPSPSPSPSLETTTPLTATVGPVVCSATPHVTVTVANPDPHTAQSYTLYVRNRQVRTEQVSPDSTLSGDTPLTEDQSTGIKVISDGRTLLSTTRTADCAKPGTATPPHKSPPHKSPPHKTPPRKAPPPKRLPFTGSGAATQARIATGLAVLAGGGLLLFYARLWPRPGGGDWSCPTRRSC